MGITHLWDINIVIYYLQQQFPVAGERFMDELLKEEKPAIYAITEIELLCWRSATEDDLVVIHNFINDSLVIEF